jgi:hypothetical protein
MTRAGADQVRIAIVLGSERPAKQRVDAAASKPAGGFLLKSALAARRTPS